MGNDTGTFLFCHRWTPDPHAHTHFDTTHNTSILVNYSPKIFRWGRVHQGWYDSEREGPKGRSEELTCSIYIFIKRVLTHMPLSTCCHQHQNVLTLEMYQCDMKSWKGSGRKAQFMQVYNFLHLSDTSEQLDSHTAPLRWVWILRAWGEKTEAALERK